MKSSRDCNQSFAYRMCAWVMKPETDNSSSSYCETTDQESSHSSVEVDPATLMPPPRARFSPDRGGQELEKAAPQEKDMTREGMVPDTRVNFRKVPTASVDFGYGNYDDLGYGDASPDAVDLGYASSTPEPRKSCSLRANNGLHSRSEHVPCKRHGTSPRRCSVTKFSLDASSKAQVERQQDKRQFVTSQECVHSPCDLGNDDSYSFDDDNSAYDSDY